MRIILFLSILLGSINLFSQDYYSDRLFVKVKEEYKNSYKLDKELNLDKSFSKSKIISLLPVSKHPLLNSTYEVIFENEFVLDSIISQFNQLEQIEYAEKVPIYNLFFTPNDPLYSTQWNLSKIQADLAWNLGTGCTSVKIAVTDDGFLMSHEDLVNQWHINTVEMNGITGIDDDGNGYIDDWRGWDAANNDNDPSATSPTNSFFTHGTHVAGIVTAQTHNSKGIASIGYNCKMIPVKIGSSPSSSLTGAFQGLDYAVNASGCDVINMSWGGGGWSATYQTLFNIAKTKGLICVAAAGNSNTSTPMYPASYNHVISVAASSSTDARASFSNFGSTIDVTAPGVNIPSCLAGATNAYGNFSGTSMAAPLVAGLCGLMKCYNPMPADSIEACLKRTCDNINTQNPSFIGQLGAGRINAFQALQCLTKKPKSDFIALDTFQCIGKSVRYAAKSFGVPTLTYSWSFPGGSPSTSTSANPVVTYGSTGFKSATLITCNSLGCDTITKTNYVNIDTPRGRLKTETIDLIGTVGSAILTFYFKGNPPFSFSLNNGVTTTNYSNIKQTPYFLQVPITKDTTIFTLTSYSDSSCIGVYIGVTKVYRKFPQYDTVICRYLTNLPSFVKDNCIGSNSPNTSSVNHPEFMSASWTCGGSPCNVRGLIDFSMSEIPSNAIINSASLELYAYNISNGYVGTPSWGTNNASTLSRITQSWDENTVTWNNQPTVTTQNQIALAQSTSTSQNYTLNIKNLLTDYLANPSTSFGFRLKHDAEGTTYNSLIFGSSDAIDTNKRPKLYVCYAVPGAGTAPSSLCRDSIEVNSAQTGWQALQTNGTWGALTASGYCAGTFAANSSLFPGVAASNCLWGPYVESGSRLAYNSSSQTTTTTYSCNFPKLKKGFSLPVGSIIDSVRLWMISDDFIDTVWVNNKVVYKATTPIHYGQIVMYGSDINLGNAIMPNNEVIVKPGDAGGCYGTYFRMKVYYRKVCTTSTPKCIDSNVILTDTSWQYQNTSGTWVPATLGINSCGQYAHATWSPSVLIGLTNQNQMIWGSTTASTCAVRKQITIPDKSTVDSIRIKVQADDNVVAMKINGTTITSTTFGWNNVSNLSINNSSLVNGINTFTLEGTNSGACAWLAMKMIIYTSKDCGSDCDTTNLNTGKVLHLDFNGNTQDKSGNGNHATNFGATAVAGKSGIANTAYRFDSTNYMSVAHHASLNLRSFTITALLKPLKFNTDICFTNTVISKGTAAVGAQWALQYAPTTSTTCFNRDTSNCNMFLCGSACPPSNTFINTNPYMVHNKWECAVLTYDSVSKEVKMYMNGVLRHQWTSTFNSLTSQNAAAVLIGKFGDPTYPGFIQAVIDDIRIYNRVLTPSEVKGYCGTCNVTPPPSDCDTTNLNTGKVLHLDFNGNTQDKSGNGNHATNYGATAVAGKDGVANTAYKFDGVNDYMKVIHSSSLTLNSAFSVTCKMKIDGWNNSTCRGNSIFFKGHSVNQTGNQHFDWVYSPNAYTGSCTAPLDTLHQNLFPSSLTINSPTAHTPYLQGFKWYCFTAVQKNDTLYNYIDGVMVYKTPNTGTGSNPYDIFIGKSDYTAFPFWLNATIDDLRVYNRSLAPSEVKGYCGTCLVTSPPSDCDTAGLVLCMSLDGNANDSTKYAHHGIVRGATPTTNRFGNTNSAYSFNGISNYISLGNKSLLKPNKATISMWIKPNATSTSGSGYQLNPLFVTGNTNSPGNMSEAYFMGISTNGNTKFHGSSWNPATSTSSGGYSNQNFSLNTWYHMTTTFDNDSFKIYINGVLDKAFFKGFATNYSTIDSIIIAYSGNNTNNQRWFNGSIDDIKMYNRVLTASEVSSLYTKPFTCNCNSTPPPPSDCDTSGLVLCMSMDGSSNDSSKYNNHGTKIGGVSNTIDRNGKSNSAFSFNGTNGYIEVPSNSSLQLTNELTISIWINQVNTSTQGYRLVDKITGATGDGYLFDTYGHPTNTAWRGRTTRFVNKELNWHSNNKPYNLNSWVHVTVTHKNGLVSYYTNGVLDTSYSHTVSSLNINTLPLRIGAGNPLNFYFNGAMDDLKIYRRALTASEVLNLYTKPFTCTCSSIETPPCDTAKKYTYTQCLSDSIQVIAGAGTNYQWSPTSGLFNDTIRNPKVFVTNNQRYLVSYTSLKNCQLIDTIDVEVKAAAVYPKMDDQLICIGDSVQMTIPIYATNIVWSPNSAISSTSSKSPYFFPSTPTTYYLEFRDTFGCLHRDTFVVNTKVCCPARARFTIPKDMLCFGETLLITNTSKGPITLYNWSFGAAIPNTFSSANPPSLFFPNGGSYTLRLIVTNGSCFDTMIKTVNVIHIIPNAGKDTTNCLGAFVTDLGESPISDWTYKWTPSKYLDDPNIANPKCSIVNDSVNYVLEIVDRNSGCKAYDTVVVYTNRKIDSTVQNLRICGGDSVLFNGIQRKTAGNYYYTLKKADGICDSFINVLRLNVLQKQIFQNVSKVRCEFYIDGKGKKHTTSFIERDTIKSKLLVNCDSIINVTSIEIFTKIYKDTTVSGCAPFRYNGKTYLVSKSKADSIRTRGAYSGCDSIIKYIHVIVYPKPKVEITPSIPNPVMYKQTVTLTASGGQTYLWLQTGSTNQDIAYKINNTQPKLYTVRVTDENGCWDTVSYLIRGELPDTCFYGFPNVFSPNQDNLNDEYIPNMDECTEIKVLAIYDRWGEKVFETNDQKGWNGYFKGKPAPMAVYLYYAELITPWGIKIHKGTFTLVR